jgi:hypothetical protein
MAAMVDFPLDHKRATDACTYRQSSKIAVLAADTKEPLGDSKSVHIIIDPDRNVHALCHKFGKWQTAPSEARTLNANATGGVDLAWD